jgi:hypothetical protein
MHYLLLFLMTLPNLVWLSLHRGLWPPDACTYGELALDLNYAMFHGDGSWWGRMLTTNTTRPPLLIWISQFFVPAGQLMGHVDAGLLLVPFGAQFLALCLLFQGLSSFGSGTAALLGCLVLASTPTFIGVGKELTVQPLQLLVVAWFVYILTSGRTWDSARILLHLTAASATALLTMLSTPSFVAILGLFPLIEVVKRGRAAVVWKRVHLPMSVFCGVLLVSGLVWYLLNWKPSLHYAQSAFRIPWVTSVEDSFFPKLAEWADFLWDGWFFLPVTLLVTATAGAWAVASRWHDAEAAKRPQAIAAAVVAGQLLAALSIHAWASQQNYRYILPFSVYLAVLVAWSLFQLDRRWVAGTVFVTFLLQWGMVHASDFRLIRKERRYASSGLVTEREPISDLMDAIVETTFHTKGTVLMELRAFRLDSGHVTFHARKKPGYLEKVSSGEAPAVKSFDVLLTSFADGDVAKAWRIVLREQPAFVVMPSAGIRRDYLEWLKDSSDRSHLAERLSLELADRVAGSSQFASVPAPRPELEIYRYRPAGT